MLIPFVLFGLLLCSGTAQAADWPSWRGPSQNGVSSESDLITEWSTEGDNLIWHANFIGRSTPIVLNGRVFVIGRRGEGIGQEGIVAAFDAENGEKIWEHAYNIFHTTIPFNRVGWASLTGDPETGYIYAHGVGGLFLCFDRDGEVVWSRSLTEEFGRISGYGGRVHTPVVDEDLVMMLAIDAGAEDIIGEDGSWRLTVEASDTMAVREVLEDGGIEVSSADLTFIPQNNIELDSAADARQVMAVMDALDDHDDVQGVFANFDIGDAVLAELSE